MHVCVWVSFFLHCITENFRGAESSCLLFFCWFTISYSRCGIVYEAIQLHLLGPGRKPQSAPLTPPSPRLAPKQGLKQLIMTCLWYSYRLRHILSNFLWTTNQNLRFCPTPNRHKLDVRNASSGWIISLLRLVSLLCWYVWFLCIYKQTGHYQLCLCQLSTPWALQGSWYLNFLEDERGSSLID